MEIHKMNAMALGFGVIKNIQKEKYFLNGSKSLLSVKMNPFSLRKLIIVVIK